MARCATGRRCRIPRTVQNPKNENWTKRDANTGRFMDQQVDGKPFKGVRKEK